MTKLRCWFSCLHTDLTLRIAIINLCILMKKATPVYTLNKKNTRNKIYPTPGSSFIVCFHWTIALLRGRWMSGVMNNYGYRVHASLKWQVCLIAYHQMNLTETTVFVNFTVSIVNYNDYVTNSKVLITII